MHNRHSKFPEDKDFFHYKDLGARKKLSTAHAIIDLIENTQNLLMIKKLQVEYLQTQKKHLMQLITCYYLKIFGPLKNQWYCFNQFRSYLKDQSQFVLINGFNSDCRHTKYGVLQSSVLRPLLFLTHIMNELNPVIKNEKYFIFLITPT